MNNLLFLLAAVFTSLSFMFVNTPLTSVFGVCGQGLVVYLFVIALIKSLSYKSEKLPRILRLWIGILVLIVLGALILPSYTLSGGWIDVRETFLPFAIAFSAYYLLDIDNENLQRWFTVFAAISACAAIYIVLNTGGFQIGELYRQDVFKNQTAPYFCQIGLISLAIALKSKNKVQLCVLLGMFAVCLVYSVTMRARTATFTTLFLSLVLLYRSHKIWISAVVAIAGVLWFGDAILDVAQKSVVGQYDIHSANSLTAGRTQRNADSFKFLMNNPLFGALDYSPKAATVWNESYLIPHMYVLWKMVRFGILGAVPFLILYFAVGWSGYKLFRYHWATTKFAVICLMLAYIESLAEYASPFGPGTTYILCYMLYGRALATVARRNHTPKSISFSTQRFLIRRLAR